MPKKLLATTIILAIILAFVVGIQAVEVANANPIPWAFNPQMTVSILSPQNGTINSLPILVSFTSEADNQFSVSDNTSEEWVRSFFYVIDGQDMNMGMRFEGTKTTIIYDENGTKQGFNFEGQAYLTNLADGPHNITVYYGAVNKISYVGTPQESIYYRSIDYNPTWQATAQFYVDSKLAAGLTLTPSPTPNITTLMPTVNTGPHVDLGVSSFPYIVGIVATLIVLIVGLLVHFKRRKGKP
jgi:hypothetical protein